MSKRTRRRHTPEQKAALVRQHVVDKKPVSEICSAAQIQPSVFYKWERDLLAAAPALFAGRRAPSREQELEAKIAALEAKLARKDSIIAEVSEEYVKLKNLRRRPGAVPPAGPETRQGLSCRAPGRRGRLLTGVLANPVKNMVRGGLRT
jgi:transposase-like protein